MQDACQSIDRPLALAFMRIYTRKGDTGTTGLLFGGDRISKADLRTDAYGTTDEAVSALGLARAAIGSETDRTEVRLADLILRLQRELFVVGAGLATHTDRRQRLTDGVSRVTAEMVAALEAEIDSLEELVEQPKEFVIPGETATGAALDLARTTVRRAERRAVALTDAGELPDSQVVPYLNRLADLLFVAARAADGGFRPVRSQGPRAADSGR
jgi:cob(I)alamin adenosyltransferase